MAGPTDNTSFGPAEWPTERARRFRKSMSLPEVLLWEQLRDRRLGGFKFRRQTPRGNYTADFYCAAAGLVVEVDGNVHALKREEDARRDAWMRSRGLETLRIPAKAVLKNLPWVLAVILREVQRRTGEPVAPHLAAARPPSPRQSRGEDP